MFQSSTVPLVLLISTFASACLPRGRPYTNPAFRSETLNAEPIVRLSESPWKGLERLPDITPEGLKDIKSLMSEDMVWALTHCQCLPELRTEILKAYAITPGAMPQLLVPRVREEVSKDKKLQLLLKLPGGISKILRGIAATEESINGSVRKSLSTKIEKVSKGNLGESLPFTFDHFLTGQIDSPRFLLRDMTPRWNLVFSFSNFWRNETPIAYGHHSLQVLESIRTLSEWKYMHGLDVNPKGGFYGGLAIETSLTDPTLKTFDPRVETEAKRFFSGNYEIDYPKEGDALSLVLDAKEKWTRSESKPSIMEQAMLWNAGAMAFAQIRPDKRNAVTEGLFGETELLPPQTHMLPVAFLRGVSGLLEAQFLDKDRRVVINKPNELEIVDVRLLSRLGRSLYSWVSVLTELEKAKITESSFQTLKEAPPKLLNGLRLVQLVLIRDNHLVAVEGKKTAALFEALALLADAEYSLIQSPIIREKIVNAFHRLVKERVAPKADGTRPPLDLEDYLWIYAAASAVQRYPLDVHSAPWLAEMLKMLETQFGKREASPWQK